MSQLNDEQKLLADKFWTDNPDATARQYKTFLRSIGWIGAEGSQMKEYCQECGVKITDKNSSMYIGLCANHGEWHD